MYISTTCIFVYCLNNVAIFTIMCVYIPAAMRGVLSSCKSFWKQTLAYYFNPWSPRVTRRGPKGRLHNFMTTSSSTWVNASQELKQNFTDTYIIYLPGPCRNWFGHLHKMAAMPPLGWGHMRAARQPPWQATCYGFVPTGKTQQSSLLIRSGRLQPEYNKNCETCT
jgi:hypothetical protein